MLALMIAAGAGLWPLAFSQTVTTRFEIPAWNIRVVRDKFTGERRCMIFQGRRHRPMVSYDHGAVSFQFPRRIDTTKASYRIDDGSVQPWTAVYPQLVETGAALEGRSLDNPTGGKVMMPLAMLRGAHQITIRPTPKARPRSFSIDGLSDVLGSARGLACPVQSGTAS